MNSIKMEYDWIRYLLPEGFPYPTSTLVSGPGGTGKPLILFAFVASWLKFGGSVIGIPLQYPTMDFVKSALIKLYNLNLDNYSEKVAFIQFDPDIEEYEYISDNILKANLLKSEIWHSAIEKADTMIERSELGTLVFGSALNLLLFSPTYKNDILEHLTNLIAYDKSRTYLFSASTSAFADEIKAWEEAADNLMYTRMEKPMKLFFKIDKIKKVKFLQDEVHVPISREVLLEIKETAEATRKRIIPKLVKI